MNENSTSANIDETPRVLEGGTRAGGVLKRSTAGRPLISVVTVVYNGEAFLEATLRSSLCQTYPSLELLVIDGGSKDRTVEVIRRLESSLDYWVSERDGGIYDAMNKGLARATGDWVIFMNGGDEFHSCTVIQELHDQGAFNRYDLVYGDCEMVYRNGYKRILRSSRVENLWKGMVCSHQSLFAKRALFKDRPFDNSGGITSDASKREKGKCLRLIEADFQFILRCYVEGASFGRVPIVISRMAAGGRSYNRRVTIALSYYNVVRRYKPTVGIILYHWFNIGRQAIKVGARAVLPAVVPDSLIKAKGFINTITGKHGADGASPNCPGPPE
ncbi:MAG: glycosyltransferase [Pedosphaera sp.]|nr:glycosyltransferase [Pedosphaera sp.]